MSNQPKGLELPTWMTDVIEQDFLDSSRRVRRMFPPPPQPPLNLRQKIIRKWRRTRYAIGERIHKHLANHCESEW